MNNIIIRQMEVEDLEAAISLWEISFQGGYSRAFDSIAVLTRYLLRNPNLSTVACDGDKIVGTLLCGHDGRRGSIYNVAVALEYRQQGIGHAMEQRSLQLLKAEGITTGFLFVNEKNVGSQAFWERIGWKVIPEIKYVYKQF